MSMRTIRRSFIRGYRQQSKVTPELGARVLRLILGLALALDVMAGHPLWATLAIVAAIVAVFWRAARELRRVMAESSPGAEGPADGE